MSESRYHIYPLVERQESAEDGLVYVATYVIEDAQGLRGEPVVVPGHFKSLEEAQAAANEAGQKVLDQLH